MSFQKVNLKILILDSDAGISRLLMNILDIFQSVEDVNSCGFQSYEKELANGDYNSIIIDPFSLKLNDSAEIIFKIRKEFPLIVFTLFMDFNNIEKSDFYHGERKRFRHYHKMNKRTPLFLFEEELKSVLLRAQRYLYRGGEYKNRSQKFINQYDDMSIAIKRLIVKDSLNEVFEKMINYYENKTEILDEITLLSLRLNSAEKEKIVGTIEYSEFNLIKQQVAKGILEIINRKI